MSTFDSVQFLIQESDASIDTKIVPIPLRAEPYQAQVDRVNAKEVNTKDGPRIVMDLTWEILDENVKKKLGLKKVTVRQGVFLDLTDEGAIDMSKGKNRQLGLIREAVGQNKDGKPWSPGMLQGQTANLTISHRPDENDPENVYSEVKRVTAL